MELTTPTGAAVAAALASSFGPMPAMKIARSGFGAGTRDFPGQPNVLRALLGEPTGASEAVAVAVIEANIDDLSPQILAYAAERLMDSGALDVSIEAITMKKGRPGHLLRVIAQPNDRERLSRILFAETTTLGVRAYTAERIVQQRDVATVETRWGSVRVKSSPEGFAPEYEDCRTLAKAAGVALKTVMAEASEQYRKNSR